MESKFKWTLKRKRVHFLFWSTNTFHSDGNLQLSSGEVRETCIRFTFFAASKQCSAIKIYVPVRLGRQQKHIINIAIRRVHHTNKKKNKHINILMYH